VARASVSVLDAFFRPKSVAIVGVRLRATLIVAALPLLACSPELDWRELKSSEGGFTAVMPAKPRYETRTLSRPAVTMHLWSAQAGKSLFAIGYADYPAGGALFLDATRNALVGNIQGNLIEETPLPKSGLAGRSLVAEGGELVLKAQLFASGSRLYQLVVLGPRNALNAADVDLFFFSFHPQTATPGN
jgi:hypothetical protein